MKRKTKPSEPGLVRLNSEARGLVLGWSEITKWSAAKVASILICGSAHNDGPRAMELLKREADAQRILKVAAVRVAAARKGGNL